MTTGRRRDRPRSNSDKYVPRESGIARNTYDDVSSEEAYWFLKLEEMLSKAIPADLTPSEITDLCASVRVVKHPERRIILPKPIADEIAGLIRAHGQDYPWWEEIPITIRDNNAGHVVLEGNRETAGAEYLSRKKANRNNRNKTGVSRPGSGIGPLPRHRGLTKDDLTIVSVPFVYEWIDPELPDSADLVFALRREQKAAVDQINEVKLRRERRPGRTTTRELDERNNVRLERRYEVAPRRQRLAYRFGFFRTSKRERPEDLYLVLPMEAQDKWRRFSGDYREGEGTRIERERVHPDHTAAMQRGRAIKAGIDFAAPCAIKVGKKYYPGLAYNEGKRLVSDELKAAIDKLRPAKKGSRQRVHDPEEFARKHLHPKKPKYAGECATTGKDKRVRLAHEPRLMDTIEARRDTMCLAPCLDPDWKEDE